MKPRLAITALCLMQPWLLAWADGPNLAVLIADRTAVERVYHGHRTGEKAAFDQAVPPSLIRDLVEQELRKEEVLKKVYSVEITALMVEDEVQRIRTTTRAPEVLEEISAALGHDPARFARCVARPIVVERLLQSRFQEDAAVHGKQRRRMDEIRARLLSIQGASAPTERSSLLKRLPSPGVYRELPPWRLASRQSASAVGLSKTGSQSYSVEATAQVTPSSAAAVTSSESGPAYLEDLPTQLQQVLRAQLQQPGDVSAVIETPAAFMLYLAQRTSNTELQAAVFTLSKRSYDEWLAGQRDLAPAAASSISREHSS